MNAKGEENKSLKRISPILNSSAVVLFLWIVRKTSYFSFVVN